MDVTRMATAGIGPTTLQAWRRRVKVLSSILAVQTRFVFQFNFSFEVTLFLFLLTVLHFKPKILQNKDAKRRRSVRNMQCSM